MHIYAKDDTVASEIKMRNLLQEVYFGKTRDVVNDLRSLDDLEKTRRQRELHS
jgi:capping protein beta